MLYQDMSNINHNIAMRIWMFRGNVQYCTLLYNVSSYEPPTH